MVLRIENVSKSYAGPDGTVAALNDVCLSLEPGDFVAIMGPSGCGKTTLLLTAGGLQAPEQGRVEVAGQDLFALSPGQRARHRAREIGFVFQQFHLVPYLSVLDNVLTPSLAIDIPNAKERAHLLIERFNLHSRSGHVPSKLSTGERQRTALARALLPGPKLLLADEPTGNLDRANADRALGYLADFAAEGGAVLLVTHDDAAADRAQQTLRLDHGRFDNAQQNGQ